MPRPADAQPTVAVEVEATPSVLKPWILTTGNAFINDSTNRHARPEDSPGSDFPFVQADFNDEAWERVDLPHDWAIKGPFLEGDRTAVGGGMGRLPSPALAGQREWRRQSIGR